jgi:hypothetical protein
VEQSSFVQRDSCCLKNRHRKRIIALFSTVVIGHALMGAQTSYAESNEFVMSNAVAGGLASAGAGLLMGGLPSRSPSALIMSSEIRIFFMA